MQSKYSNLIELMKECIKNGEEILLTGYDTKPLENKLNKAETK